MCVMCISYLNYVVKNQLYSKEMRFLLSEKHLRPDKGIDIPEKWQFQRGNRYYLPHRCFYHIVHTGESHRTAHFPYHLLCVIGPPS